MDARKPIPESCWLIAGLTVIASMGTGLLLGGLASLLYHIEGSYSAAGVGSGGFLGFVVGVGYVMVLMRLGGAPGGQLVLWGTLGGIVAGLVAAGGVHGVLMCAAGHWRPQLLEIGLLFGLGGGAVLGLISSSLFCWCFKAGQHDSNSGV